MARLLISREISKNSLLTTALQGVKTVLQRETGLKSIVLSADDKVKADLKNKGNTSYPYAYLRPSDAEAVRDQGNARATQRYGLRTGTYGATRNTSRVGFIFPVRLGMELVYVDDDALRMYRMTETFLILAAINMLNFDIRFANQLVLNTRIQIPENTTIPLADTGDTTKPGGMELTLSLIIHTYAGFFRDVSSVYAADPMIGYVLKSKMEDGEGIAEDVQESEFEDYETQIPREFTSNEPRTF